MIKNKQFLPITILESDSSFSTGEYGCKCLRDWGFIDILSS